MRPGKGEWVPEQPKQDSHQGERKQRKRQPALAVKRPVKEAGIHVDSEPRDSYNPDRILQDGYGKDAQDEAGPLPVMRKQKVLR